jgi:dihydropteroate synthase
MSLDRPRVIAILNLTPDSFSDGGTLLTADAALDAARRAASEGADALDLGGESTRPGATRVPADEQIRRIVPVVLAIRESGLTIPISIDTTLAPVAEAALNAGADAINDISAGRDDPAMFALAAARGAGLILMHRLRAPADDQYSDRYPAPPAYDDVVHDVRDFIRARAELALSAGVSRESIVVDPGLGFGKSVEQNVELIRRTGELAVLGYPVLSGVSRKSFVGRVAANGGEPAPASQRDAASIAFSIAHLLRGARLFRVHAVRAHREALDSACTLLIK